MSGLINDAMPSLAATEVQLFMVRAFQPAFVFEVLPG
jgi:hypothetical protein